MSKEMIISVNGREKKIAIVEDDVVTEFYVERGDENQGIVGNIYKGRVMKVLPGMQSAFVDIGLERDSFLYVSDFFDEEEEEEVEEKKETQRQVQKQPRAHREGLRIAPPAEQEPEEDKDLELRMAALRQIKEIAEEPAIEPSPEEEGLEAGSAEAADEAEASLNPRQRRQRRLRYAEKEPKAEKAPAAAEVREAKAAAEAETEEEFSGRRRRRPRRRRGDEAPEAAEALEGATKGDEEHSPYIIVHHEPLERVMDDDTAVAEGEMLKDAMLQTRISERIREEERRSSLLEVEPTPEVLVGSLRRSIASELGFERVSDDSETRHDVGLDAEPGLELDVESDVEPGVRPDFKPDFELDVEPGEEPGAETGAEPGAEMDIESGKIEPISEWAPAVYETLVEAPEGVRPDFEPTEIDEDIQAVRPDATQNGDSAEPLREAESETPEEA